MTLKKLWWDGCVECHWRIENACGFLQFFWVCMQSVADVEKRCRSRWFGHLAREIVDDWGLACRNVEVAGVSCRSSYRTGTLGENSRVNDGMIVLAWFAAWMGNIHGYAEILHFKFEIQSAATTNKLSACHKSQTLCSVSNFFWTKIAILRVA